MMDAVETLDEAKQKIDGAQHILQEGELEDHVQSWNFPGSVKDEEDDLGAGKKSTKKVRFGEASSQNRSSQKSMISKKSVMPNALKRLFPSTVSSKRFTRAKDDIQDSDTLSRKYTMVTRLTARFSAEEEAKMAAAHQKGARLTRAPSKECKSTGGTKETQLGIDEKVQNLLAKEMRSIEVQLEELDQAAVSAPTESGTSTSQLRERLALIERGVQRLERKQAIAETIPSEQDSKLFDNLHEVEQGLTNVNMLKAKRGGSTGGRASSAVKSPNKKVSASAKHTAISPVAKELASPTGESGSFKQKKPSIDLDTE
eukprot:gnl/MRDRNA2_/MRDRNA2_145122_c0_seq1.p1 gnl/MRDRNA2_/MRDRNA2_145122_c0~~gnl/MRDRNA2_/MRDRNA2_145122_c0_seq1.p1  ORF type:complete len:350 (-),score=88.06 gnl/MRDRNA2_/MRDRNA2_145122_c0_seq1:43-984(-)